MKAFSCRVKARQLALDLVTKYCPSSQQTGGSNELLSVGGGGLRCQPLAAVVVAAGAADVVGQARRMAARALADGGRGQLVVGSALRLARAGMASLG